jgi:hypothetical protein
MINGTIDAAERAQIQEHLRGCAACQRELDETRRAASVFGAHLPTSAVIDLVWERPNALDPAVVAKHLEQCQQCAEELAMARESRRLANAPELVTQSRPVAWWSYASVPASLAAGLAVGLFWASTTRTPPPPDDPRVAPLESEVARLRGSEQALRQELDSLRRPQINLPVYEIVAADEATRSTSGQVNQVMVPAGATQVAFVFGAGAASAGASTVELRDAQQKVLWSGEGLRPGPLGAYALAIPRALVPDGDYVLAVRPPSGSETTYALRIRAQR